MRKAFGLGLVLSVVLVACGGGGGGSPSPSPPSPPSSSTKYTVGGNVSGLTSNESVTLLNNGGGALIVSGNGGFTFSPTQDVGSAYAITVKSHTPGIACSVNNGSGSVSSSNVTNVDVSCVAGIKTTLYSFGSGASDTIGPQGNLLMDGAGNLYGTSYSGGTTGVGTVFKISTDGRESVLYSFAGGPIDGANPKGGLVMDSNGNLYGTTSLGGINFLGAVFKVSPDGKETILHSFSGGPTDGSYPWGQLAIDSAGNLYGTTTGGGAYGGGLVFKISPDGTESVVHSFAGSPTDGRAPHTGLTMDRTGNLYGTTDAGGLGAYDFGTVFKISPDGTESVVYTFQGADGGNPGAEVTVDSAGNILGTTLSGGNASVLDSGVVYKISPTGTESILHYFIGGITSTYTDGGYPHSSVIMDSDGNLFGTTSAGGTDNIGTVFKISPDGKETTLYSFVANSADGNTPYGGLILDSVGNLYGTTGGGGANAGGTFFKID